jgi:hypothetical protein
VNNEYLIGTLTDIFSHFEAKETVETMTTKGMKKREEEEKKNKLKKKIRQVKMNIKKMN